MTRVAYPVSGSFVSFTRSGEAFDVAPRKLLRDQFLLRTFGLEGEDQVCHGPAGLALGVAVGFIIGFLVFRNNAKRLQKSELDIKDLFKKGGNDAS